jgi:hypothetical protein
MKRKVTINVSLNAPWWRGFSTAANVKWGTLKRRLAREAKEAVDESGVKVVLTMDTFTILDDNKPYYMDFEETDTGKPISDKEARDAGVRAPGSVRSRIASCFRDIMRTAGVPRLGIDI